MAATTAIVASVGEVGYNAYQGYKQGQATKKAEAAALAARPNVAADQAKANAAALSAESLQAKRTKSAQGFQSTVLTGSQSPSAPPATKTLLGL